MREDLRAQADPARAGTGSRGFQKGQGRDLHKATRQMPRSHFAFVVLVARPSRASFSAPCANPVRMRLKKYYNNNIT